MPAPGKLATVVIAADDEQSNVFPPEDRATIQASREYLRQGGHFISFEHAVAECGFTMEQITGEPSGKGPEEH